MLVQPALVPPAVVRADSLAIAVAACELSVRLGETAVERRISMVAAALARRTGERGQFAARVDYQRDTLRRVADEQLNVVCAKAKLQLILCWPAEEPPPGAAVRPRCGRPMPQRKLKDARPV